MSKYTLYGCGGHARSVAEVILHNDDGANITFVDEAAKPGEKIFGFDVLSSSNDNNAEMFVAIGSNKNRMELTELLDKKAANIISSDAHIGRESQIGSGCFIGHEAYLGPLVRVGDGSIINTRAILEHEVKLGNFSQVGPRATIGGRTTIGDNVFIGLGATIIDGLAICSDVTIGAGAVVTKDISHPGTYVGIPARRIDGEKN
jgi:sugar O-acyltransferase (sialic acid O-acetyltransferase NeuD family)